MANSPQMAELLGKKSIDLDLIYYFIVLQFIFFISCYMIYCSILY